MWNWPRGALPWCRPGHPHPLLHRADGLLEEVGIPGVPVGLLPDVSFEETVINLAPGDRLLVGSDGITECPDATGQMLETEGLCEMMQDLRGISGTALLESMVWRLGEYAGMDDFPDDISAVLLEYPGPGRATL